MDCEWIFGDQNSDIKCFDIGILQKASVTKTHKIFGSFYWQKGVVSLAKKKEISSYLLLGEPFNVSIWVLCILIRVFHPKRKIYFWTHGWYGRESRVKKIIKKAFFRFADKIFLYGNYAKKLMIKEGFKPDKLVVIHNSLDYEKQLELRNECKETDIYKNHFENNNSNLIFIGRLTKIKKINQIIQALEILKKEGLYFNLTLIGGGKEENNLKNLVKDLNLENQVWFYGPCYDEKTNAELIYNADLCVSPGNVGLTAIHSMMFGTPVISHNDFPWQMPEFEAIMPGGTGDFFNQNDVGSLSETIKNWFSKYKNERDKIRQNCFQEIDSSWNPDFQMNIFKTHLI